MGQEGVGAFLGDEVAAVGDLRAGDVVGVPAPDVEGGQPGRQAG